jgi:predicted nucleotidyltransferase
VPGPALADLPAPVARVLEEVLAAARGALGDDLHAAVLFGSAAEGRLRPTSDVNLIFVLEGFDPVRVEALRGQLSLAQAAVRLAPMFLRRDEVQAAAEAFAQKFADIGRRHRVLLGPDPFA